MRFLIIDDDDISCEKLVALLSDYGDCDTATEWETALDSFIKAHQQGNPYTLLTIDIEMPGMLGPDLAQKIREWEIDNKIPIPESVKILIVSIKSKAEDVIPAFEKGGEWFVSKPVNPEKIISALVRLEILKQ